MSLRVEFVPSPERLVSLLKAKLSDPSLERLDVAVAFARISGIATIESELSEFLKRGSLRLIVGLDFFMTSYEALLYFIERNSADSEIFVYKSNEGACFHPKLYAFRAANYFGVLAGSSNLTGSGMQENSEVSMYCEVTSDDSGGLYPYSEALASIDDWIATPSDLCVRIDRKELDNLRATGQVLIESEIMKRRAREYRQA